MRKFGDCVYICYRGSTDEDGTFDERSQDNPLRVAVGMHALPKGLDDAVREMGVGEEEILILPPEDAFGIYNPSDVIKYPLGALEKAENLKPGDIIRIQGNKQGMRPAFPTIIANDGYTVTLDFNHPMAGKTVTYWVRVVKEVCKEKAPEVFSN